MFPTEYKDVWAPTANLEALEKTNLWLCQEVDHSFLEV